MRRKLFCAAMLAVLELSHPGRAQAQQAEPPALAVGTFAARLQPIAHTLNLVGRVKAVERVDVTARVRGYLQSVLFSEGEAVRAGDPLYEIEPAEYEAAVKQASGALDQSRANLTLATLQRKRAAELFAKGSGTAVARDQTVAAELDAEGGVTISEANLAAAQLNLSYTRITSPIDGRVSATNVTKGNVVGPESGVLTTIVSQDPMYVQFPVSQREFLKAQIAGKQVDTSGTTVRLRFPDGSLYAQEGHISFLDVIVDQATDTVMARATMPNPAGALVDGQLLSVELESGKQQEKVVVPQSAILADQSGTYVFVAKDGKAEVRRLRLGGESGPYTIVEEGLEVGDAVIVEGLQGVRPNLPVDAQPLPASMDPS